MERSESRSGPTLPLWPLSIGSGLLQGALAGVGELVDRLVKPEPDATGRPYPASITTLSTAKRRR